MSGEGKLSRAIEKAGAQDKLSSQPQSGAAKTPPLSTPAAAVSAIRRVKLSENRFADNIVIAKDREGEIAAQIRALRMKLLAMNNGNPPRVITVSSGSREEGKSTVSFNLAAALSEISSGRVLLVDGDLLRPSIHLMAGIQPAAGITEVLQNNLDLDERIYETTWPNLDILPCTTAQTAFDIESLMHQLCGDLILKLRNSYTYVIIDTPPILAGSQASTFGKNSDGVLLVARVEKTPRHVVQRAADELRNGGSTILGCVLTHQKHHIPNFIYRFLGTTPARYYRYGRDERDRRLSAPVAKNEN